MRKCLQTWSSVLPQAYSRLLRWNWSTFSSSSLNWIPDSWRKFFFTSWTFSVEVKLSNISQTSQLLLQVFRYLWGASPGSATYPSSIPTPRPGWRWSGSPCACRWLGQWPAPPPERGRTARPACASLCPSATEEWRVGEDGRCGVFI